jgi:hypothetical protein
LSLHPNEASAGSGGAACVGRHPHQRGKLVLAGAIEDLIQQIARERQAKPAASVTYNTWVIKQREGKSQPD